MNDGLIPSGLIRWCLMAESFSQNIIAGGNCLPYSTTVFDYIHRAMPFDGVIPDLRRTCGGLEGSS